MRESEFIDKNKEKWAELEELSRATYKRPRNLYKQFIDLTDDLSYARTFFGNRSVRSYLNGIGQSMYFMIYKVRNSRRSALVDFWKTELPLMMYAARREMLWAAIAFFGAVAIGAFSAAQDPDFVRTILGDGYVNMTLENIANDDPMAVYKDPDAAGMTFRITLNNLFVDLLAFFMGLFYAVGALGVLVVNGVMVGAFQYFFIEKGVIFDSLLTIWMHGTLEMSAAVISGGAGIVLGRGLVLPGTLSRIKALQLSARRGFLILLGILPLTIIAGVIEGFITRLTYVPYGIRFVFIFLCFAFVFGYYWWYPRVVHRKTSGKAYVPYRLAVDQPQRFNFFEEREFTDSFLVVFSLFRRYFKEWITVSLVIGVLYAVGGWLVMGDGLAPSFPWEYADYPTLTNLHLIFYNSNSMWFMIAACGLWSMAVTLFALHIWQYDHEVPTLLGAFKAKKTAILSALVWSSLAAITLSITVQIGVSIMAVALFTVVPFFVLAAIIQLHEPIAWFSVPRRVFAVLSSKLLGIFTLIFILGLVCVLLSVLIDTVIINMLFQFIGMLFSPDWIDPATLGVVFHLMLVWLWLSYWTMTYVYALSIGYFQLRNAKEAVFMNDLVKDFGQQKQIRGIARE